MWRWRWRVLAESLGILQVSVLVKRAEEVVMRGAMTGMEVAVVDTMVLIEMVVDLAGAIEIVVLKEDHEMTAIIRTVLVPMNVVVQETSVQGRKNSPDRAIEDTAVTCWRCQSLFCCISSSWFSKWTNLLDQTVDVRSLAKRFNCLMSVNAHFDVVDPMTLLALLKQSNLALLFQCYDEYWILFCLHALAIADASEINLG
ncbi:uncharacterized protein LOC104428211 isoform X1 [Eucalyptus grandis]|uniref:uncharacterized protein LOC104428211 isoform X1 n=1 Tax=Eucalyptus grandis TaxID=71139 RepID=UPI00192EC5C6|nr:uncharacterized protein LOC104428211 isoform X1 [Eucalyptus grandis]